MRPRWQRSRKLDGPQCAEVGATDEAEKLWLPKMTELSRG